jgi:hypothetical protein
VNKRRLLKLAVFLDTLPPKRFNFGHWVGMAWKGNQDLSCGTTACAIGWCPTIPAFRRLGLRIVRIDGEPAVVFKGQRRDSAIQATFRAAGRLFQLTENEVDYLFTPTIWTNDPGLPEHATAKQVARHIRKFVDRGGMPERAFA